MFFGNINYIVIIIASLVSVGLGFLWYSPFVFGPLWLKTKGWTDEHMKAKKHGQSMVSVHSALVLSALVSAFILSALFNSLVVTSFWGILFVGFYVWLGFMVPVKLADYLFGGDSFTFFLISVGHQLLSTLVMALIIGIFG